MWFDGLKRGRIEMPVYSDVANKLKIWSSQLSIRLFVFSNGWSEMSKRILSRTNHGDLSTLIEDYYDTELGELTETATFTKALALIKEPPETVVFLTKNAAQARAALSTALLDNLI